LKNKILGVLFGLAPVITASSFAFFLYISFPNFTSLIISALILIFSFWLGFQIFKKIQSIGLIEFLTATHASPDMDNLQPSKESGIKCLDAIDYSNSFTEGTNLCKGGTLRIYGAWYGKPYENNRTIIATKFNQKTNTLEFTFSNFEKMVITNPSKIMEGEYYLKVMEANKISIRVNKDENESDKIEPSFLEYTQSNKEIIIQSNMKNIKNHRDISLGSPALMIYAPMNKNV